MRKRDYLGFRISSFTLYPIPSPSTLQLFMACFCAVVGRNRTVWVLSRATGSSPVCWGPGQSPSASGSSLSRVLMSTVEKLCFSLCELLQLLLLLCISETKLSPVLQHPFLHLSIHLHQTQTSLKLQDPIIKQSLNTQLDQAADTFSTLLESAWMFSCQDWIDVCELLLL